MFNLDSTIHENSPSFRELFSYFARRQLQGGFVTHEKYFEKQKLYNQQILLSYLLGLDYTLPQRLEKLAESEKETENLIKALKEKNTLPIKGNTAEYKAHLALIENKILKQEKELNEFKVVEQYRELSQEANHITSTINTLNNANTTDKTLLSSLEESRANEEPSGMDNINRLYEEAGVILGDKITKRFEEVIEFHKTIVANRKAHLKDEINATEKRLSDRNKEIENLDKRRSHIMCLLQTGGALETFNKLANELTANKIKEEQLRHTLEIFKKNENQTTEHEIERQRIFQRLLQDHNERNEKIKEAIITFEEISKTLYEKTAILTIDATKNGPTFNMKIDGERSRGIKNMQIFCFDMMLMIVNHKRHQGPGFLIHDSHLFDGVDERQIEKALEIGKKNAEKYNFQYIVTLNSDVLPTNPSLQECILQPTLTDKTETGGLFGFRFN